MLMEEETIAASSSSSATTALVDATKLANGGTRNRALQHIPFLTSVSNPCAILPWFFSYSFVSNIRMSRIDDATRRLLPKTCGVVGAMLLVEAILDKGVMLRSSCKSLVRSGVVERVLLVGLEK
jgi:hypothetical protein